MNKKLTKAQVASMTSEELQETKLDLAASITSKTSDKDKNIIKGFIDMIEIEQHNREKSTIESDPNGNGSIENIDLTDKPDEQEAADEQPAPPQDPSVLASLMANIHSVMLSDEPDNTKLARIMKLAEHNVDYTNLPYDLCSDAELLRRLKLLWSKRVAAKKAGDFAKLDDIEKEESLINEHRTAKTNRTGAVSSDNVDHSKMDQVSLGKLIRNYQSKKSSAKKLYEAAVADGLEKEAEDAKNLMEHWQAKVDDASKYRTSTPAAARSAELTKQITDMISLLKSLPQTPEIAAQISKLESSI